MGVGGRRKRSDGREECVERGGGCRWYYPRASIQPHRVVFVPLPASLTDVSVDGEVHLRIELQSEGVGRWKWVALLAPTITALPTTTDGTAAFHAAGPENSKPSSAQTVTRNRGRMWVGEQMGISMEEEFKGAPYNISLRVVFC
jgi:hypothetical protein